MTKTMQCVRSFFDAPGSSVIYLECLVETNLLDTAVVLYNARATHQFIEEVTEPHQRPHRCTVRRGESWHGVERAEDNIMSIDKDDGKRRGIYRKIVVVRDNSARPLRHIRNLGTCGIVPTNKS